MVTSILNVYGKGGNEDADYWKSVIRQTLIYQYLEKDIDNIGNLKDKRTRRRISEKTVMRSCLARDHDFTTEIEEEEESADKGPSIPKLMMLSCSKSLKRSEENCEGKKSSSLCDLPGSFVGRNGDNLSYHQRRPGSGEWCWHG